MPYALCPACGFPSEHPLSSLPCSDCRDALLFSPRICPVCYGFDCTAEKCERPWVRVEGESETPTRFTSIHAAYLSIGPGFRVLKTWKKSRNPPLERYLLEGIRRVLRPFESNPEITLIPVPQTRARKWELFGGSTLRLCEMIAGCRREKGLCTWILEVLQVDEGATSQAKTKGTERYRKTPTFRALPIEDHPRGPVVLVDDFLTSGTTLRNALGSLPFRNTPIHALVLGFRPSLGLEKTN